jgi:hypothetical protein
MRNPAIVLSLLGLVAQSLPATELSVNVDLSVRALGFSQSGEYDLVTLEGAAMTTRVGAPALPALAVNVVIPQGMMVTAATCVPVTTEGVAGSYYLMPTQPPRSLSDENPPTFIPPDPAVYSSESPYPARLVEPEGQNSVFGYNVDACVLVPFEYSPLRRTLKLHQQLTLTLTLEPADLGYLPVGERSAETRQRIEDDVRSLVLNPDDVHRFAPAQR